MSDTYPEDGKCGLCNDEGYTIIEGVDGRGEHYERESICECQITDDDNDE
jgi:hypothetical protein